MASTDTPALTTIRLLLVDDSVLVRRGVRGLLEGRHQQSEFQIVGEAGSVAEAVALSRATKPDVVLLDIRLPDGDGFAACRAILHDHPHARILMLTSFANDDFIHQAIVAGAHGYLMKEVDPERLIEAVVSLHRGESILGTGLVERVLDLVRAGRTGAQAQSQQTGLNLLSGQERRVLALVAEGRTNKEIGVQLGLSDNTVKNYLVNVFDKLKIKRRSQAAALWVQASPEQNT
ncbi:MAG: response regulator transcription factor [Opitutaceae bacterium]|jgi:DNA-binding NarL/FixJ family response regulator|nr:response regulator transcription factor [Opitutaceae bacterium]